MSRKGFCRIPTFMRTCYCTLVSKAGSCAPVLNTSDDFQLQSIGTVVRRSNALQCEARQLFEDGQLATGVWNNRSVILVVITKGWSVLIKSNLSVPCRQRTTIKNCGAAHAFHSSLNLKAIANSSYQWWEKEALHFIMWSGGCGMMTISGYGNRQQRYCRFVTACFGNDFESFPTFAPRSRLV